MIWPVIDSVMDGRKKGNGDWIGEVNYSWLSIAPNAILCTGHGLGCIWTAKLKY